MLYDVKFMKLNKKNTKADLEFIEFVIKLNFEIIVYFNQLQYIANIA